MLKKPKKKQVKTRPPGRGKTKKPSPARKPKRTIVEAPKQDTIVPGEILLGKGEIIAFGDRATVDLMVVSRGDRPIQVGSHCHFFEVNRALRFDREQAFGFRLRIPSGTATRFEPGEEKRVTLVAFAGNRIVHGINGLTSGSLDDKHVKAQALARAAKRGFMEKGVG